ncbi:hypothetical protein D3C86_1506600 [compost metagenome]
MDIDHDRSTTCIETRRPDIEEQAVLALFRLGSPLRAGGAIVESEGRIAPRRGRLGRLETKRRRAVADALEDADSVLAPADDRSRRRDGARVGGLSVAGGGGRCGGQTRQNRNASRHHGHPSQETGVMPVAGNGRRAPEARRKGVRRQTCPICNLSRGRGNRQCEVSFTYAGALHADDQQSGPCLRQRNTGAGRCQPDDPDRDVRPARPERGGQVDADAHHRHPAKPDLG